MFFYLALHPLCHSQQTNTDIVAEIESETLVDVVNIKGTLSSRTQLLKSLRYEMLVFRKSFDSDKVAKAENKGRIVLKPSEKKSVAEIKVNQNTKDKVTVLLLVYNSDDKLVAKDRKVVLNDDETTNQNKTVYKPTREEDFDGFRGIVTESTKTKPGRDFYIEFYSIYNLNRINGKEVVKITEQFSFGRSTIMEVSVGNVIVHRFFTQPTRDYILKQAKTSINAVTRYFINLDNQKSYIKQY